MQMHNVKRGFIGLGAAALVAASLVGSSAAIAQSPSAAAPLDGTGITVGVSWANFQEERWKADEAAIKSAVEASGATYISTDAQSSATKQQSDVESLITDGADVLIIVPWDVEAIKTAIDSASAEGIPTIAYDRQFEDARSFYMSFDNVEVGRMLARAILDAQPKGTYAIIKGNPGDSNPLFLLRGIEEVLKPARDAGDVVVCDGCEVFTDGWKPENAQKNMEQILTAQDNKIDAVVSENDGMAGGVVAALTAQGLQGIPVSGQDGDKAALNRVALGTQTVSVWKDVRTLGQKAAEVAIQLAKDPDLTKIPGASVFADGEAGVAMNSFLVAPVPILKDNLQTVIDAGWIDQATVCAGVTPEMAVPACP
jgi:D-xylose transport system substrate-binding protein